MGNTTSVAWPIMRAFPCAVMAILAVPVIAKLQQPIPADERPAFEAATIKRAAQDAPRNRVMPTSPNRLNIPSMTLSWLIYTAHGDGGFNTAMRVTGGPDWVNRMAFAVEGVASANVTPRQRRLMLQRLLEERFALKLRTEVTSVDMNVLVVDRRDSTLGPKVKEWDGTCKNGKPSEEDDPAVPRCLSGYRPGGITLDGATMFSVAEVLSLPQARALLGDHTVLSWNRILDPLKRLDAFRRTLILCGFWPVRARKRSLSEDA
jgi:uncharacterized protein (TIGR03435 family)